MIFLLLLAFLAITIVADPAAQNGADLLRSPIKRENSPTLASRDGPEYGPVPLRTNATQKHYLSPYTVDVAIGSPPQLVHVALDPFTNDLWVDPDCSTSLSPEACCANGVYNPNNSAAAKPEDCSSGWFFDYDQSGAEGCTVIDDVQFAGVDLGYIEVGVANHSWGQSAGQLGLGFGCKASGDVSILDHLKQKGLVTKRQFSIAIGSATDLGSSSGTREDEDVGVGELVFSGVNTGKFAGDLRPIGAVPSPGEDPSYFVAFTSIGLTDPFNCKDLQRSFSPHNAVFDYSTILSYFPADIMLRLTEFFPDGFYNLTKGAYEVPCDRRAHDGSVDFYFDKFHIEVPLSDFILEEDGSCYLGAVQSKDMSSDDAILGLSFLRAAYTVYDIDSDEIYVAQYEDCGDYLVTWDPPNGLTGHSLDGERADNNYNPLDNSESTLDDILDTLNKLCQIQQYTHTGPFNENEYIFPSLDIRIPHKQQQQVVFFFDRTFDQPVVEWFGKPCNKRSDGVLVKALNNNNEV
ncbi:aspartic peptidase domain-containing protein [Xylariaceae sp. FL0594]|nr:aspartic peptidase domain-containing protein [Xylariaceae sp. FL0594]